MEEKASLARFLEHLFTPQERLALGFLLAILFGGLIVIGWKKIMPPPASAPIQLKVRVNTATVGEMASLHGIGPVTAQRIVADRRQHGLFLTLKDLARVKGVSPKTLEKLKGLVRFD